MESIFQVKNLHKKFGSLEVLKGIDLEVKQGEVVAIVGPSGTGKSTLLRCINFLEQADKGTIRIQNDEVDVEKASKKEIYQLTSHTAMVFQSYCLFKNMTALQNVMEPLRTVQKVPKAQAEKQALELLEQVGLLDKKDEYPSRLSGGQQQRVGIARAMAVHPQILLFDEPTSALDVEWVDEVLAVMRNLAAQKKTMIVVTHEMRFAKNVADTIVYMRDGVIKAKGSPEEIFNHSGDEELSKFFHLNQD